MAVKIWQQYVQVSNAANLHCHPPILDHRAAAQHALLATLQEQHSKASVFVQRLLHCSRFAAVFFLFHTLVVSILAVLSGALQPNKVMSKSGRWVASPTVQGATQAHSFFGRPSKAAANSPTALQGASNQPFNQSSAQGPITASWSNSDGTAQHGSNAGSMPSTSSAPSAPAPAPGRWQGFTQMLRPRPRPHRHGSGPLLANTDPAVLSSIPESDPGMGVVDASQSTDTDDANAASAASRRWALSATSLSPRRNSAASQGTGSQPAASQGSYIVPSPWSTPVKPPQSSSASPERYLVPSPQNTPLGTPPQSSGESPQAVVGPFEAAARAKAAQGRAARSSPGDSASSSNANRSPPQAVYPIPSPATSSVHQQAPPDSTSPAGSTSRASSQSHRSLSQAGGLASSPARDWSSAIPGMTTTKASGSRGRQL